MTVLGRLFGLEERADYAPVSIPPPSEGGWGQGMVWHYNQGAVTADSAMRQSAVFACLRLLSEAICTLPIDTFRRVSGTRVPFRPRPDYLSFRFPQGSRVDYFSQVVLSLLTNGNAYVATPRDEFGVPIDLVVLDPLKVQVDRSNGAVRYRVNDVEVDRDALMHIKGMTMPGALTGLSPIGYARESIGLGLAAQTYGRSFFANGALPSAVVEAPNGMTDRAIKQWQDTWNDNHQGASNGSKIGVLTEGAKFSKVSIAPNEAQFLESRQFQVPDIARFFGVPPHLIADASNSTSWGSGLAEQNSAFGQFSLRPWIERIEDGHTRLLASQGLPEVFLKLNVDALLRSSTIERYKAHAIAVENHLKTPNECRADEDLPPLPGGDEFPAPIPPASTRPPTGLAPQHDPVTPPGGKP